MGFQDKEFRREFCMFAALAVGALALSVAGLSLSHNLGYWPHGHPLASSAQATQDHTSQTGNAQDSKTQGDMTQWLIFGTIIISILGVSFLYYLGRKVPQTGDSADAGDMKNMVPREEYDRALQASATHEGVRGELKQQLADCKEDLSKANGEAQKLREDNRIFHLDTVASKPPGRPLPSTLKIFVNPGVSDEDLVLSTDHPATLENIAIGPLVSMSHYEYQYEVQVQPGTLRAIKNGESAPFKITWIRDPLERSASPLRDVLARTTPETLDAVVIEFESNGVKHSQQCTLTKKGDGIIAWRSQQAVPTSEFSIDQSSIQAQSLASLRSRLSLADGWQTEHNAAELYARQLGEQIAKNGKQREQFSQRLTVLTETSSHLQVAGRLALLAEDATVLSDQFRTILADNVNDPWPIDLAHPFATNVIGLSLSEHDEVIPWQRRHLMCFKRSYNVHRYHVKRLSLSNFESVVLKYSIPNDDLDAKAIQEMLLDHSTALSDRAQQLITAYENASGS